MKYKDLTEAIDYIKKIEGKPVVKKFNCNSLTFDWIKKEFGKPNAFIEPIPSPIISCFYGIPIDVVDHVASGFIEIEMSDNTRQIIDLRTKQNESRELQASPSWYSNRPE